MMRDDIKNEALSLATEDWEPLWAILSVCGRVALSLTGDELRDEISEAILSLITEGLVDLCERPFPLDAPIEPYTVTDAKKILGEVKNWDWESTGTEYGIAATDLGMDSYFGSRKAWDRAEFEKK